MQKRKGRWRNLILSVMLIVVLVLSSCATKTTKVVLINDGQLSLLKQQVGIADSLFNLNVDIYEVNKEMLKAFILTYRNWVYVDSLLEVCLVYIDE